MSFESTPGYYGVIPAPVLRCKNLNGDDKCLYADISALTSKEGYCYAGNAYFAELYNCHERTIQRRINALESEGFITVELIKSSGGTDRRIWLAAAVAIQQQVAKQAPKKPAAKTKTLSKLTIYPDQLNYEAWIAWLEYKRDEHRWTFKTEKTELTAINKLIKDTSGNQQQQANWIESSIANGYKGIFGGNNVNSSRAPTHHDIAAELNEDYWNN
ncbi:helix-turn-helix domain-containing protein [uncultured Endozoicomonas sp.]|uniref:helix-turn-helix domain-containing protein n=1 Tax=uncultured Endozoicomonas sp. TaxID=432652 RepID=UPI0026265E25|nr:helix-turn-helix domain-containing protein [uncultured Endozoicomonas sp.]